MTALRILAAALTLGGLVAAPVSAQACGADTDCVVEDGTYRVVTPDGAPKGAILYFHGWQGTAPGVMRNGALARVARERDLLLIAPNGRNKTWAYPGSPSQARDDFAFVDSVMADVETRFGVTRDTTMVTGFYIGGSMAWSVACYRGEGFLGFAPVAGAFWDPIPESCPSPVPNLLHVHGTSDTVVPMEGRPIGDGWHQSDVRESLAVWYEQGACDAPVDQSRSGLACEARACGADTTTLIELCLHPGGHSIRTEWVAQAWDKLAILRGMIGQ
ncbi:MAG: polyhydroxybutyrate depolymerase [Pseudomonadota bacterium]